MKTKRLKMFPLLLMAMALYVLIFSVCLPSKSVSAETTELVGTSTTIDDVVDRNNFFTLKASAVGRNGTAQHTQKSVTTENGDTINYYCYNWRDLASITFSFAFDFSNSKYIFTNYEFLVTAIQSENLSTSIGQESPTVILSNVITNNKPEFPNIYYYIDSDTDISGSATKFRGIGFGLYKFDFNYSFVEDDSSTSTTHKISIGELFIAVLPDDIDSISANNVSLTYTVGSSSRLMNVYQLSFSNKETFRYVNPKYIKWTVIGKDKSNSNYVLTKQTRDKDFPSYKYIWESLPTSMQEGNTFVLDTNDIEGNWTVYCTIYNSDGSIKATLHTASLSTIKHKEKSYIWLIILIILCVIALCITIGLIIYRKKNKDKV